MTRVVDAHHHAWSLARGDYAWLTPALAPIYRDFDLDDYTLAAPVAMHATVLVQAAPTVAETRYLLECARGRNANVKAVVGFVDLDADNGYETLVSLAADPLLRSVRPMLQDLADPRWILRPPVLSTVGYLPRLGLAFDALVKPAQLPAIIGLLEAYPDLRVVVDHGGKPAIADGQWEPWASLMQEIARHPHAHCKLSGLATQATPGWTVDTLRPYVDHLLAAFGTRRMLWGSDWPVVELNGGFQRWWHATQALLAHVDEDARDAILGGNALRFYGMK